MRAGAACGCVDCLCADVRGGDLQGVGSFLFAQDSICCEFPRLFRRLLPQGARAG